MDNQRKKKKICDITVIMPDSWKYMVWDVLKSILYTFSIYTLAYLAVYKFKSENEFLN
jgi:hypothetical protein